MIFKKRIYILFAACLLLSTPAVAELDCGSFPREWTTCLLDEDCMTGTDYCRNPLPHARKAATAIGIYNSCMQRDHVCTVTDQPLPKELPICAASQCVAAKPIVPIPGKSYTPPVQK